MYKLAIKRCFFEVYGRYFRYIVVREKCKRVIDDVYNREETTYFLFIDAKKVRSLCRYYL